MAVRDVLFQCAKGKSIYNTQWGQSLFEITSRFPFSYQYYETFRAIHSFLEIVKFRRKHFVKLQML